ncbi:MAG: hypothetical protein FWE08_08820 [Oscillospiraceae bacterium]|nr:hypothetical protein [Oscillospiraceae bacterium]
MDEYRGRYEAYHNHQHREEQEEPIPHMEPTPPQGMLSRFGLGDGLDDYLPILLILLGAVGVYLWLGKQGGGLGGLLGGFMK